MNIYQALKNANIPIDSHESDLYVPDTEEVRGIIARHFQEWPDQKAVRPISFLNACDGKRWLELPFAYQPWWDKKAVAV